MFPSIKYLRTGQTVAGVLLAATLMLFPAVSTADDEDPTGALPGVAVPRSMEATRAEALAVPTERTTVFFNPLDSNGTVTILFLTNTERGPRTARLTGFSAAGDVVLDRRITVPPLGFVRIAADSVSTSAPSWDDTIIANFRDSTVYAQLILPRGLIAEGYVAWNGNAPYDPNLPVPTLPLRFWTRPGG